MGRIPRPGLHVALVFLLLLLIPLALRSQPPRPTAARPVPLSPPAARGAWEETTCAYLRPAPYPAPSAADPVPLPPAPEAAALQERFDFLVDEISRAYLPMPKSREELLERHASMVELQALGPKVIPRIIARMTPDNRGRLILALGLFDHPDALEAIDNLWIEPGEWYFPGG